jgi:hypothetical protein
MKKHEFIYMYHVHSDTDFLQNRLDLAGCHVKINESHRFNEPIWN